MSLNVLVLLFVNAVTHISNILHRRGAEGAESICFLFAAERQANEKIRFLCVLGDFAVKSNNYWNIGK